MRRFVLGPVLCLLIIGLIGVDFGQIAQAQTTNKKEIKSATAKKYKTQKKIANQNQARLSTRKTSTARKKTKTKHASTGDGTNSHKKNKHARHTRAHRNHHTQALRPCTDMIAVSDSELPQVHFSDLWLAKDSPDTYKKMYYDEQLDDMTRGVLESAYKYLGTPYRWGGTTPDGFDCSGFVRYVFNEKGISLGRSSHVQAQEGRPVRLSDLKPGDLIFFKMHHRTRDHYHVNHVGLYIGNKQFIHASCNSRTHEITVEDLESEHYLPRIVEVRRVLDNLN